jgi:hypothetical protein
VVEKLIEALSFRQIGVVPEEYAASFDVMKIFGGWTRAPASRDADSP